MLTFTIMKNILICENDEDIVFACRVFLENRKYKVTVCKSTDELFEKLNTELPDLILMDIWIPTQGGEEATKIIKKSPKYQSVKIFMFSANSELEAITKRAGADGFLAKPFNLSQLLEIVEKA